MAIQRPDRSELESPYHGSFDRVPEGDILQILTKQVADTTELVRSIGEKRGDHRYAPGKWSIKEVVGHLADTERIMSYRALAFARGDGTPLPGFEQDDYAIAGRFERRRLIDLAEEFRVIRASTLALFRGFDEEALLRRGTASGAEFTVRAIAFLICGHEIHHKAILRERYL